MFDCSTLKQGDRVWVGREYSDGSGKSIRTVARLTRTQIVIDWNGNGSYIRRFRRSDGYGISVGMMADQVMRLAAPAECKKWDADLVANRDRLKREQEEKEALEKKRLDLAGLFTMRDSVVSNESWGEESERKGKWTVEFHGLNESQVRFLADLLREFVTLTLVSAVRL